jgi:hypothetical protein
MRRVMRRSSSPLTLPALRDDGPCQSDGTMLTITTAITPVGPPALADPATLESLAIARDPGVPRDGTIVGTTVPVVEVDLSRLRQETRNDGAEFMFSGGTLGLSLRQEVHLSRALNPCARPIWLQHEMKHVRDNEQIMPYMDRELRGEQEFIDLVGAPTEWRPRGRFAETQAKIRKIVNGTFERLKKAGASRQDSVEEYRSVERQIRLRCAHAVGRVLRRGMYGQGIDIVQLALNNRAPTALPRLRVDGVFGTQTEARVQEFQQAVGLEPDGVVGPATRQALGLLTPVRTA